MKYICVQDVRVISDKIINAAQARVAASKAAAVGLEATFVDAQTAAVAPEAAVVVDAVNVLQDICSCS